MLFFTYLHFYSFFVSCSAHPPDLLSFPTRRSSDLRSGCDRRSGAFARSVALVPGARWRDPGADFMAAGVRVCRVARDVDRKSTRLNSSHMSISYAVFCLKKKNIHYRLML